MNAPRWTGARTVTPLGWVARVVFFLGVLGGCRSGDDPAPVAPVKDADPQECAPGNWLREDGSCQPAGLPLDMPCPPGEWPRNSGACQPAGLPLDMPCPPGERLREEGGCQPAGVPPEDCAEGFAPDGNGGCEVILPAEDCPTGQMAIPGETVCHEVAPCGPGDYGDVPVDPATTQFVNQAYAGADSNGSEAKPWKTIQQGIDEAAPGAIVAVAAGSYDEDVLIEEKPVVLWGRCPALVEVAGTGVELAALQILSAQTAASEVRGIAITSPGPGVVVAGMSEVVIDRVWIHDAPSFGLYITDQLGPTSATVTNLLIEVTRIAGVFVESSDAELVGIVVRDVQPNGAGQFGVGIVVQSNPQTKERAHVKVAASVVERTHDTGVFIAGADAELLGVVVRDTQPEGDGALGYGISIQNDPQTTGRARAQITASVVERVHFSGVFVESSDAELVGLVVRDVQPTDTGKGGTGITVQMMNQTYERSNVQVTASVIEQIHESGVLVFGSDVDLLGIVVRDVQPDGTGARGVGIASQYDAQTNERANVQVTASVVERTHDVGVNVLSSDASLSGVVVRDSNPGVLVTSPAERANLYATASMIERTQEFGLFVEASDAKLEWVVLRDIQPNEAGERGLGIGTQCDPDTKERGKIEVIASLVERAHYIGVFVRGSDAAIAGTVVRDTQTIGAGINGRGINIDSDPVTRERARVNLTGSLIERNTEIGVLVSDSDADISGIVVRGTQPNGTKRLGRGIQIQRATKTDEVGAVQLTGSIVEGNNEVGVFVVNSDATIEGSIVRTTSANEDGSYGDGLIVMADGLPAELTIAGTIVDSNARAGLASWGAQAHWSSTVLSCNGFDLQGEAYNDIPFSFPDSHDNFCGCPAVADVCNALSTGLSPPPPLDDLPAPDSPSSP